MTEYQGKFIIRILIFMVRVLMYTRLAYGDRGSPVSFGEKLIHDYENGQIF